MNIEKLKIQTQKLKEENENLKRKLKLLSCQEERKIDYSDDELPIAINNNIKHNKLKRRKKKKLNCLKKP